jgi:hypothetical protein
MLNRDTELAPLLALDVAAAGGALVLLRVLEEGLVEADVAAADDEVLLLGDVLLAEGIEAFCVPFSPLRELKT